MFLSEHDDYWNGTRPCDAVIYCYSALISFLQIEQFVHLMRSNDNHVPCCIVAILNATNAKQAEPETQLFECTQLQYYAPDRQSNCTLLNTLLQLAQNSKQDDLNTMKYIANYFVRELDGTWLRQVQAMVPTLRVESCHVQLIIPAKMEPKWKEVIVKHELHMDYVIDVKHKLFKKYDIKYKKRSKLLFASKQEPLSAMGMILMNNSKDTDSIQVLHMSQGMVAPDALLMGVQFCKCNFVLL